MIIFILGMTFLGGILIGEHSHEPTSTHQCCLEQAEHSGCK